MIYCIRTNGRSDTDNIQTKYIYYWRRKCKLKNNTDKNSLSAGAKKADANSNNYEKSPLTGNASIFASIISAGAGLIILAAMKKRKER